LRSETRIGLDIIRSHIWYAKDKLALYAVAQHNAPVSSKSPQKELDLSPPNSGLFFRPVFPAWRNRRVPFPHMSVLKPGGLRYRILDVNKLKI
jgi:hypothetical protein